MQGFSNFRQVREAAAAWATRLHAEKGQRYGSGPYSDHLAAVEQVLIRFGFGNDQDPLHQTLCIAAWSHDLLEDVGVDEMTMRVLQGPDVAALVRAVTLPSGPDRKRNAAAYPVIRATPHAVVLKLADRIANIEASIASGSSHFRMYQGEHPGFRAALFEVNSPAEGMWQHLDSLLASVAPGTPQEASVPLVRGLFEE